MNYWPWSEAQVIIIDDVGPLIAPQKGRQEDVLAHFRAILEDELKPIADILAISPRTVSHTLERIYRKLDVTTRTAAAARALESAWR